MYSLKQILSFYTDIYSGDNRESYSKDAVDIENA